MLANKFFVFEGLSGSGKTTIAKKFAKKIGAKYFKTPPHPLDEIRDFIDDGNLTDRYYFYLNSIFLSSELIKKTLYKKHVVCDRYIYTTLAFHAALGVTVHSVEELPFLKKPDHVFLVECQNKLRHSRLLSRGLTFNDKMEIRLNTDKKFNHEYRKFNMIKIDNSGTVEQSLEKIDGILKKL